MPYPTLDSLPESIKELPEAKQRRWRAVWNSVYSKAKKDGKSDADAEKDAFTQANGVIKKMAEPNAEYLQKLRDLIRKKVKDNDLSDADITAIIKAAAGYSGGMARSRSRQKPAATEMIAAEGDGLWVGYWLPPEIAQQVAIPGGIEASELHMTLSYIGNVEALPADATERLIAVAQSFAYSVRAVDFRLTGAARFRATDRSNGKDVIYATVDGEGLSEFRWRLCYALAEAGINPSDDYGWVPHVTLAYVDPGTSVDVTLPDIDVSFDAITVSTSRDSTAETRPTFRLSGPNHLYGAPLRMSEDSIAAMEPPATLPLLPKPGEYQHPTYGTIDMSPERIAAFVDNFEAGVYQNPIAVDLEHETKLSGAAGWITALITNADGSVDGVVDWTDRGQEALKRNRYAYVSPEWYEEWVDPIDSTVHQSILIGAALTTRPFFKADALRPLAASELTAETEAENVSVNPNAPKPDAKPTPAPAPAAVEPVAMSEDTARRFSEMQATIDSLTKDRDAHKTAAEHAATQSTQLAEQVKTIANERRRERFTSEIIGKSDSNNARYFGEPAEHLAMMEHLADTVGEDSDLFKGYVTRQRALGEQMRSSKTMSEIGTSGQPAAPKTAAEEIEQKVAALVAADPKISAAEATDRVVMGDSDLATRYYRERTGLSSGR